jgi:hypothetical protein
MTRTSNIISWVAQLAAAAILAQTLYFKFTAAPESVYIFSTLGLEPYGRIGSGIGELIAAILLLIPSLSWLGAAMGLGVISGALFFHLTTLGIVVQGDGGLLFALAVIVFVCCIVVLALRRYQWLPLVNRYVLRKG